MENIKTLKVVVKDRETRDGRKFKSYSTFTKEGRRVDLKFTKDVVNPPQSNCTIYVAAENMNLNLSKEFPVVWVEKIESVEYFSEIARERNNKLINDYFD